jgi:hypothetical protein
MKQLNDFKAFITANSKTINTSLLSNIMQKMFAKSNNFQTYFMLVNKQNSFSDTKQKNISKNQVNQK